MSTHTSPGYDLPLLRLRSRECSTATLYTSRESSTAILYTRRECSTAIVYKISVGGLYTSLFCAIIPTLFPYFLPFWYPYILLHFLLLVMCIFVYFLHAQGKSLTPIHMYAYTELYMLPPPSYLLPCAVLGL